MRAPDPYKEPAAPATNEERPRDVSKQPYDTAPTAGVHPDDVLDWTRNAPLRDLLDVLDPNRDVRRLAGIPPDIVARCPQCRRRSAEVASSVFAWCALCGADWTRWAVARLVLSCPTALRRIAAEVAA